MDGRGLVAALGVAAAACAAAPLVTTPAGSPPPICPLEGCEPGALASRGAAAAGALCASVGEPPCGGMPPSACTDRALGAWSAADDDRSLACVARLLADACSLDEARACGFAGRLWLDGRGVAKDTERGLNMLVQACDGGIALACAVGARFLAEASSVAGSPDRSDLQHRFEMESACLTAQSEACFQVGLFFHLGQEGFPHDPANAVRSYERGCNLGESRACNNLGDALAYGEGVERDLPRAAEIFAKACRLGEVLGCANLGYRLEHGFGVMRDVARARTLYRESCATGSVYGCLHAEMLVAAQSRALPRDPAAALAHWVTACERGRQARACAFVGLLYDDGPDGLARDETRSMQAMGRGCDLGETRACDWVRSHSED